MLLSVLLTAAMTGPTPRPAPTCAPDNAGLKLPAGFCAVLVADSLGPVRHLAVTPRGDLIAAHNRSGVLLLRDTDGNGTADERHWLFQGVGGSGLVLASDAIYFAANDSVLRIPYRAGDVAPAGAVETIARGLPRGGHSSKGLALGQDGALYVSFGSLTNSCQKSGEDRRGPYPSPNPCLETDQRAGIWRFDARKTGQTAENGVRHATGLRNPMALSVEPSSGTLYMAVHGRDQLTENWKWSAEDGRENPAEEFGPVPAGADYGWPYCFYNPSKKVKLLNPEYGGDGTAAGDCASKAQPAIGFPAHWAPNALMFYTGSMFPAEYRGGAFLAFHGSWNRAPAPQQGYRVVFIPFQNGKATGTWKDFVLPAGQATDIRPTGLAQGPDGSLYVSDDAHGKIWRILAK
ncbi:MAG: sorbosone dehydrogenase family protein [Gemmatimonadales bacterium]